MDRRIALIFAAVFALIALTHADAQTIGIVDCQGFTRAVKGIDGASTQNVQVEVADAAGKPAQGVEVTLSDPAQGTTFHAAAQNGVATFNNIPPGIYTVQSPLAGTSLGAVSIGAVAFEVTAATVVGAVTVTAGGAAVAGAAVVTEQAISPSSSSNEAPTPTATSTPGPTVPPPTPQPTPQETPTATPTPVDCNCDPDEIPPDISEDDFYANAVAPATALSPSR